MKTFYLLLSTLSIAYANTPGPKCTTNVNADTGVLTWDSAVDGVTIPNNAFLNCNTIKSAVITGVSIVSNDAFSHAGHVNGMDLTFDASLQMIYAGAFQNAKIKSFTAPNDITIFQDAFYEAGHDDGMDLTFDGLLQLSHGNGAFRLAKIKSMVAPKLHTIAEEAFDQAGHDDGMDLTFDELNSITKRVFYKAKIKSMVAPKLTTLSAGVFDQAGHDDGMHLTFDGLTTISSPEQQDEKGAFHNAKIKSMVAPSLTSIGVLTFELVNQNNDPENKPTIQLDLNFPQLTTLENNAFESATIKSLVAPRLTTLSDSVFKYANGIAMDLTFDALTSIDNSALLSALIKSLVAPLVTSIGSNSFEYVNQQQLQNNVLLDLNFPLLTNIPESAFQGAELNRLIVPSINSASGTNAFHFTQVREHVVISKVSGLVTSTNIKTIHYVDDVPLYLPLASQGQLKTEYHSRGLLTEDVPLYLPLASPDQLKTEYQSRGSCA